MIQWECQLEVWELSPLTAPRENRPPSLMVLFLNQYTKTKIKEITVFLFNECAYTMNMKQFSPMPDFRLSGVLP